MSEQSRRSTEEVDQLFCLMSSVINKRKTYPGIIAQLEKERIAMEIKQWENAKVNMENEDCKMELKAVMDDTKRLMESMKINSPEPKMADIESQLRKKQQMFLEVTRFLQDRAACKGYSLR